MHRKYTNMQKLPNPLPHLHALYQQAPYVNVDSTLLSSRKHKFSFCYFILWFVFKFVGL